MCRLSGRHGRYSISTPSFGQHRKNVRCKIDLRLYRPHTGKKVWTHAAPTLAPDSRHIVAFLLSSTTSRAADSLLSSVRVSKWVLGGLIAAWLGGGFFQGSTPHVQGGKRACRGLTSGSNCSKNCGP